MAEGIQPSSRPHVVARTGDDAPAVTAVEVQIRRDDPTLTLIDVRDLASFNGWRRNGATRGGHIPRAVAFPAPWFTTVDDAEVGRLLESKGVHQDSDIVVYGDGLSDDATAAAAALQARGFAHVRTYAPGWNEWAADASLPAERLARYEKLVHTDWLAELLAGGTPEAAPAGRYLLFHVNFGVPEEYADSHIPTALFFDTNSVESPHDWNRRRPADIDFALRTHGITSDTTVILYGRDTEGGANEKWPGRRAGQIAATRAAMILHYAGVEDIRVLDGGYDAWVRTGHDVETTPRFPASVPHFGVDVPLRPGTIVDIDEAKEILADPDGAALVSVRSWNEHIGRVSGYNYIGPAGRIAGDVWGNCGSDAYHMQHYRTIDNTMRPYTEIAAYWASAGITPDKWVAFYCGTGWRASETWFYAYLQAYPRIAVYDGGWFEWSADPVNNPIEVSNSEELSA